MLIKPLHSDSFCSIRNLRCRTLAFSMLLLVFATSFAFAQRQKIRSEFDKDDWWAQKAAILFSKYQFTLASTNPALQKSAPSVPDAILATYNWNANSTSATVNDWSNGTSWTPNIAGGPDSAGDIAIINNDITADRVITLFLTGDSGDATKTVGRLDIGDSNGTHKFTISTGSGAGILEFDSGGASAAQLNELSTSVGDTISAPIRLKTSLDITNSSTNTLTLSGGITSSATSGTQTISLLSGAVSISGAIGNGGTGGISP